jgi:hypothetical protein
VTAPDDPLAWLKLSGISGTFVADTPLSRLAQDVYSILEPYAEQDAALGYGLRTIVEAMTKTFVDIDELVRESPQGDVGWSAMFDADRAPPEALAWLGQVVGTSIAPADGLTETRWRVANGVGGIRRGSLTTMIAAMKRTLTGNKTVFVTERVGDAWHFSIRTRTSETPSTLATTLALISQKPAGLIGDYATYTGILFQESLVNQATYSASLTAKATYTLRGA